MKRRKSTAVRGCEPRSPCPIANTLDILGDKWTLLVVRDLLFLGKRQYGEFIQSGEGIPTNILADRLKRLEETGLLTKEPYQSNPVRHEYHLTPKGADLFPVLKEIVRWANKHIPGTAAPPAGFLEKIEKQRAAHPRSDRLPNKPSRRNSRLRP
jgi:DNA-binding HxlR family transcriptional regulator